MAAVSLNLRTKSIGNTCCGMQRTCFCVKSLVWIVLCLNIFRHEGIYCIMLIYYSFFFFFFFLPLSQPVFQPPPRPQPAPARSSKDARGGMNTRDARLTARNAPDNHQVFIGNLPAGVKDEEVRNVFSSECTCGQIKNIYIYIYIYIYIRTHI